MQSVFLISGVDALRAVSKEEIFAAPHPRDLLQNLTADFFGGSRPDGRFKDDDCATFHILPDSLRARLEDRDIRFVPFVDWGRKRDNHDSRFSNDLWVTAQAHLHFFQFLRIQFLRSVLSRLQFADAPSINVVSDSGIAFFCKSVSEGKSHVAETNDTDGREWFHRKSVGEGQEGKKGQERQKGQKRFCLSKLSCLEFPACVTLFSVGPNPLMCSSSAIFSSVAAQPLSISSHTQSSSPRSICTMQSPRLWDICSGSSGIIFSACFGSLRQASTYGTRSF